MRRAAAAILVLGAAGALVWWSLRPAWLRVVTHDGRPIRGACVRIGDSNSVTHTGDGYLQFPREQVGAGMRAVAPGCRVLHGTLPARGDIALQPGHVVTFRIPGDYPLPPPPYSLDLELWPEGAEESWDFALHEAVTDPEYWMRDDDFPRSLPLTVGPETRTVDVLLPQYRRWRVEWAVGRHESVTRSGLTIDSWSGKGGKPVIVDVLEGAREVEVPLTWEALRRYAPG